MVAVQERDPAVQGVCRLCGRSAEGALFDAWVKDTFTDWDKIVPGSVVCDGCLFWLDERSDELARRVGKDKPQRMRNYSHFVVSGEWEPVSKGNKRRMRDILLGALFPELAVVSDSGQKHIALRAVRNDPGHSAGWVQFEEHRLWVDPPELARILGAVERLYTVFSKSEIASGQYGANRILKFGIPAWRGLESQIKRDRGSPLFDLAIFLAQKEEDDGPNATGAGGSIAGADLEGDAGGLQEPLPPDDLAAVRGPGPVGGVHEQPGPDGQLSLFAAGGDAGGQC